MAQILGPGRLDLVDDRAIIQGSTWTLPLRLLVNALPAPKFAASAPYVVGNYVSPSVSTGYTYLVVVAGTSGASEPTWPTVLGGRVANGAGALVFMAVSSQRLLDTTGYDARMKVKDDVGGTTYLDISVTSGQIVVGYEPNKWVAATAYALGQQVVPTVLNGYVYECVAAGTSHATTQPTWPTTDGAIVTDGTVTWRNVSSDSGVYNLYIGLTAAFTAGLTSFGQGRYDIEIVDLSSYVTRIIEGVCVLSEEITT